MALRTSIARASVRDRVERDVGPPGSTSPPPPPARAGTGRPDAEVAPEVVARFRDGEPDAVRIVYRTYGRLVFGVALKSLGDRSLAEEATQETFVRAWRSARSFDPDRSLAPWLSTIVRRVAIDLHRRESRRPHEPLESAPEAASSGTSVDRAVDVWSVRDAVAQLPPDEQAVMRLQHGSGLTHEEIAQHLAIPVGTVKSRSFRAHRRLRALLGHPDGDQARTAWPARR